MSSALTYLAYRLRYTNHEKLDICRSFDILDTNASAVISMSPDMRRETLVFEAPLQEV